MQIKKIHFISTLTLIFIGQSFAQIPKVIYGNDDRYEVDNYPDAELREMARASAAMIKRSSLIETADKKYYDFSKAPLYSTQNICINARFSHQPNVAVCSGFLVAPDVLVTAGHCVADQFDCARFRWVFDYKKGVELFPKEDVYKCKNIINQKQQYSWFKLKDYSVIKLDRPVVGRTPMKIRRSGFPLTGTKLVVIGHPTGLPAKIADGAKVKFRNLLELVQPVRTLVRRRFYFMANLDTFAGNSGSPVINLRTKKVEGILINGSKDYTLAPEKMCKVPYRKSNSSFVAGETVFRITKVKSLNKIIQAHSD